MSFTYGHPGNANFDVADRLAIINLISSYAERYEREHIDGWFELFTNDPKVTVHMGEQAPACVSGQEFRAFFCDYLNTSLNSGIIPRHLVSNIRVRQQSERQAEVSAYITYIPLPGELLQTPRAKEETRVTGTALYVFQLEKGAGDDVWRIREYTIRYDQAEV